MQNLEWPDFWWTNITGSHAVVKCVVDALLENKNVILRVPSDIPWRHSMRSAIQSEFSDLKDVQDAFIKSFDMEDDNPSGLKPGRFLLERLAPADVKVGYREKSKISIQNYIISHSLLKNQIIWIKGLNEAGAAQWISFCKGFPSKSVEDGLFVLEVQDRIKAQGSKKIKCINYSDCVSNYDLQLFNSFILDEKKDYSDVWKRYIASLAAIIFDTDAEISEFFIQNMDFRSESPVAGIQRIIESGEYERRGAESDSNHILSFCRQGNFAEIEHRIWSAQVQVLFPLIELERIKIIDKYEADIGEALRYNDITQYGELLEVPLDTELGTLAYMINEWRYDDSCMLPISNGTDRAWIFFLRDCRNNLAHAFCCSPEQVTHLIEKV